jgi:hypothetical protein
VRHQPSARHNWQTARFALSADELDRRQIDSVQMCELEPETDQRRASPDQAAEGIAVRVLKPTRINPVPDLAFE